MKTLIKSVAIAGALMLSSAATHASVIGSEVSVFNSFEQGGFTGGVETLFASPSAYTVTDGVEVSTYLGLYDIDAAENSLTMTLANNSGAFFTLYDDATVDRYYFFFQGYNVTSASLANATGLNANATVSLFSAGDINFNGAFTPSFSIDTTPVAVPVPTNGFVIAFGEGTDIRTLGVEAMVNFTTEAVSASAPASIALLSLGGLMAFRRRVSSK